MIRLGLCCKFSEEEIVFRTCTATAIQRLSKKQQLEKLSQLCLENAQNLEKAIERCATLGIGAFRVLSQILPLKTHPAVGYKLTDLPHGEEIEECFKSCGEQREKLGIRLLFHPDQFVVLNSPKESVVEGALKELLYQCELSELIGADVVLIHGGGAYGDKPKSLETLTQAITKLPKVIRSKFALENDDKTFSPADLLPVCEATDTPLVYDVHHHRCLPDGLSEEEAFKRAKATWSREPVVHLSSPVDGWGKKPFHPHHDFIDEADVPPFWKGERITIEVEAKAKETSVLKLRHWMVREGWELFPEQAKFTPQGSKGRAKRSA